MGTTGSFTLNLETLGNITNSSVRTVEFITLEIANQGSLIGLAIAISIALTLIFGTIMIVVNFIPALIRKVKGIRKA
ncbi:MAG: hypothetical protein KAU95_02040 [Candidatus Aenigmarchaeota archaeon]|nr:hypothetical protein [Candidatus Aenigmarchaeota archaeon]